MRLVGMKPGQGENAMLSVLCAVALGACENQPLTPAESFDLTALAAAAEQMGTVPGALSLLAARGGVVALEEYYNGHGPESLHDVRSVTKSILSSLVGIAIQRGRIDGVDRTLPELLGSVADFDRLDPLWASVTLEDLLTMSAGHGWRELGGASEFTTWRASPDQVDYILAKAVSDEPGTTFNYSDGSAHLVSAILEEATGMHASEFAARYLFEPMGIPERPWLQDNRGYNFGGVGIQLTSRDMLQFGMMFLDEGEFGGAQVVPSEWIATSTVAHILTGSAVPNGPAYGYFWWRGTANGREIFFALGYGGQFIVNVPDADVVIVATCRWNYSAPQAGSHVAEIMSIIEDQVIPAIR